MWHPWCFQSSAKPFTLHQQILLHFFLLRCQTVAFCSLSISVVLVECCSLVGTEPGSPPLLVIDGRDAFSLSAGPESPASAAQLHRRRLHPLLQLHHRPPLFTSTCIHEDKLPGDHSGLLQFRRFFCRDEATVELVAQAEGGRVTYCAYSFCSTIQWTNAEHTFCRHAIHATS